MATITIEHEASASKFAAVEAAAQVFSDRNPNCNGMVFEVVRGDFTSVDSGDAILDASLLITINDLLEGRFED